MTSRARGHHYLGNLIVVLDFDSAHDHFTAAAIRGLLVAGEALRQLNHDHLRRAHHSRLLLELEWPELDWYLQISGEPQDRSIATWRYSQAPGPFQARADLSLVGHRVLDTVMSNARTETRRC